MLENLVSLLKWILFSLTGGLLFDDFHNTQQQDTNSSKTKKLAGVLLLLTTGLTFAFNSGVFNSFSEEEKLYWESIDRHPSQALYQEYLVKYPKGHFKELALTRLNEYAREAAKSNPTVQSISRHSTKVESLMVNGVKFEMVTVPAGIFLMGSPEYESERDLHESPQHQVTVPTFQIGKYEVTQQQWQAIMGNNPSEHQGATYPVENVSWDDIQGFISRLNQLTEPSGHKFYLPTEAQWEYAARAGSNSEFYPFYKQGQCITNKQANFDSRHDYNHCGAKTDNPLLHSVAVGSYQPNAFGLYDMAGNVWEWVQDCWHEDYVGAPSDGSVFAEGDCAVRVLRGGAWINQPSLLRSANRENNASHNRSNNIGFRLARM